MTLDRRTFLLLTGTAALLLAPGTGVASNSTKPLDVITALETRRSVRHFTSEEVSDKDIALLLRAGMVAPSAANQQAWDFVVIKNSATLNKIGEINNYASYARKAPLAILVCLNEKREKIKGMGILDIAMSAENILIAAHGIGLGAVFTGIYPLKERIKAFQSLLGLPANVIPIGLIVLGHPEDSTLERADERYKTDQIHMEKW